MSNQNRWLAPSQEKAHYQRMDGPKLDREQQSTIRENTARSFEGMIGSILSAEELSRLPSKLKLTVFDWGGTGSRISKIDGYENDVQIKGYICQGNRSEPREILKEIDSNSRQLTISHFVFGKWISLIYEEDAVTSRLYLQVWSQEMGKNKLKIHLGGDMKGKVEWRNGQPPLFFNILPNEPIMGVLNLAELMEQDPDRVNELVQPLRDCIFNGVSVPE